MSGSTPAKRSRGVRMLALAFAALFVVLCLAAAFVYFGWRGQPAYWEQEQQRLAALTQAQRQTISESLSNRLLTQWSDPGTKTPHTEADLFGHRREIAVSFDDLNTWIKAEGIELLSDVDIEMPESVQSAMIDSPGDGLVRISAAINQSGAQQILAMSFAITIADDGTLTSTLSAATAGRLPLPVSSAIDLIASNSDGGMLLDLMQGNPVPAIVVPIDPSKDGLRDGRLVGLEVREDALVLTRETVRRKRAE